MNKKKIIIIAIIIVLIAIVAGLIYQYVLKDGFNKPILFENIYDGEATEKILEDELEVKLGLFGIFFNFRHGIDEPRLRVTLTNKLAEAKSFTLEVAAVDKEAGTVLKVDTLEVEDLEPDTAEKFDMFTDVNIEEEKEEFLHAEYKIVKITSE